MGCPSLDPHTHRPSLRPDPRDTSTPHPRSLLYPPRLVQTSCPWACLTAAPGFRCPPLGPLACPWHTEPCGLCSPFVPSCAGSWAVGKETLVLCCSASRGERVRDFPLSWAAGPACQDDGGPGSACWGGGERSGGWRGGGGRGEEPEHMNQQISLGAFNLPLEDRGVPLPVL